MTPLVSFVIPVFNQEDYIEEAVVSALGQSHESIEVICVDDGSSDRSAEILAGIDDPRLRTERQENSGPSMALNAGIKAARGAFIAVMGGDDVSEPTRVARQLEQIQNGSADIVFCLPRLIGPSGATLMERECHELFSGVVNLSQSARYSRMFYEGNHLCAPSMLARREVFGRVGLFHPGLLQLQDFEYWIRALGAGLRFAVSEERLVRYRRHGGNLSHPKRVKVAARESVYVWDRFFDGADPAIIRGGFADILDPVEKSRPLRLEEIALIYTSHESKRIRELGVARLIETRRSMGCHETSQVDELMDFGTFRDALETE